MASDPQPGERINLFSLVTYLPHPLAGHIDRIRQELVPDCRLRAHVTHLVPRPLQDPDAANRHIRETLARARPFEIRLDDVEIFTISSVVYVALTDGFQEMLALHADLNRGAASFDEPYPFHPHVTLAQRISPAQVPGVFEHARYRWAACRHDRRFLVDRAVFVQGARDDAWIDLEEHPLAG
ncbi:MAG: 2'-5' RNA ligase family protein [Bryobacterales bacterium]|nr:2'-5' RNA ligase family protein [Bryobacterales bacterium]